MTAAPKEADLFARSTDRSRTAVVKSENLARRDASPTVDPRHLLLGVIAAEGTGLAALRSVADVSSLVEQAEIDDAQFAAMPRVPYAARSKKLLEQALVVAVAAVDNEIRTEHLLAALIDFEDEEVVRLLEGAGVHLAELRQALPGADPHARAAAKQQLTEKVQMRRRPTPQEEGGSPAD